MQTDIEDKLKKIQKAEGKIGELRKRQIELEADIRKEEAAERDYQRFQDSSDKATQLITTINQPLIMLKVDPMPPLKKMLKAPDVVDVKEIIKAVSQRCGNAESIQFAINELEKIAKKFEGNAQP